MRHVEGGQRLFNRLLTSNDKKHGGLEEHEVEFCQKAFEVSPFRTPYVGVSHIDSWCAFQTPTNDTILSALKTIQKCLQLMSETRSALGSGVLEAEEEEEMEDVDDEDPDMEGYEGLWGPDLESDEEIDV